MKKKIFKTGLLLMTSVAVGATLIPSTVALADQSSFNEKNVSITKEEAAYQEDGLLYIEDNPFEPNPTARQIIADGSWKWKQINKKYSDTKQDEKFKANVGNLVYNVAFAYFGGKLIKGALKLSEFTGAVSSGFLASVKKPIKAGKTVYLTITTYEDKDSVNYYVKENVKAYSDSKRTKQVGNYDSVHKFRKK
ncbi:hypothetical protein [Enterococcus sp. AZ126]|uniref:hypothetical protein n=1 Tax=Enterococcus sp. AZ126 TaxID=2774635 RepID=UPI003F206B35